MTHEARWLSNMALGRLGYTGGGQSKEFLVIRIEFPDRIKRGKGEYVENWARF